MLFTCEVRVVRHYKFPVARLETGTLRMMSYWIPTDNRSFLSEPTGRACFCGSFRVWFMAGFNWQ